MNKKQIITTVALILIVGAGMFWAGRKYEAKKEMQFAQTNKQTVGASSQQGSGQAAARSDMAVGEVTAKDESSMMVKLADGSLKKVMFSGATTVRKTDSIGVSDVAVGQQVTVSGKTNDDGTLAAAAVAIRPAAQATK